MNECRLLKISLILLILFTANPYSVFSQRGRTDKKLPKKSDTPRKIVSDKIISSIKLFSDVEFDTSVEKLGASFAGHSFEAIYKSFENREASKKKGEFETTAQYKERMEKEEAKAIVGTTRLNSLVGFVLKVNSEESGITNIYDADTQIMKFNFSPKSCLDSHRRDSYKCFNLSFNESLDSKFLFYSSAIEIENWNDNKFKNQILLKLIIEKAIIAKNNSNILFIGKLTSPFYSEGSSIRKKSYWDKELSIFFYKNLHIKLEEIWIFNKQSGEIYSKLKMYETPTIERVILNKEQRDILLEKSLQFYKNGNDIEAIDILEMVLISEPNNSKAYLMLGNIQLRRGDVEQAVSSFKTALFWDNHLFDVHISLGKIYLEKGDCLQAKNYTTSAIAINKNNQGAQALQKLTEECSKNNKPEK